MRILLACQHINDTGGSELYHYELARQLVAEGHTVAIVANTPIRQTDVIGKFQLSGVETYDFSNLPNDWNPTVIQSSQPIPTMEILKRYGSTVPIVSVIHSEIRSEDPIMDSRIKKYICIRPMIQSLMIEKYRIPESKTCLIYNGIDLRRFHPSFHSKYNNKSIGLFVGEVLDPIRIQAATHLIESCRTKNVELWFVSKSRFQNSPDFVKFFDPIWNVEIFTQQCDFTAGILLGRTTLEGFACNAPGYIYNIDVAGKIHDVKLEPAPATREWFDIEYTTRQLIDVYHEVV